MSKYTGVSDFRDTLDISFDNDFKKFMGMTNGVIYRNIGLNDVEKIIIQNPSALIPYYPYVIATMSIDTKSAYIVLSEQSYLDERIDMMEELNAKFGVEGGFQPFNTDYFRNEKLNLYKLYKKSIEDNVTTIIG